jgi:hypothetical protein
MTEDSNGEHLPVLPTLLVDWRSPKLSTGIPGADRAIEAGAQKAFPGPHLNVSDSGKG